MQRYVTMVSVRNTLLNILVLVLCGQYVCSQHVFARVREYKPDGDLRVEPPVATVQAGTNVSFTCSHPRNATFLWELPASSKITAYEVLHGSQPGAFFSRITIFDTSRFMSGEIACSVDEGKSKALGYLSVSGVQIGGECHNASDCITDRAVCENRTCHCPSNFVRLRLADKGFDVCREMIYSLYDKCEFTEQCAYLVDPKSVCSATICVCAPYARDRKGRCISLNEISYNRSQEMYRVGLIAVTCIIILIVAMSLWVTLKRSCNDQSNGGSHGMTQTDVSYPEGVTIDPLPDKPPSYDDIELGDAVSAPPNIKDALKHCMTAKRLLRQVSAPAGQLLPQQAVNTKPKTTTKPPAES